MHSQSLRIRGDYLLVALVLCGLANLVVACSSTKPAPPPSKAALDKNNGGGGGGGGGGSNKQEEETETETETDKASGSAGMWDSLDPNCKKKDSCPPASPELLLQGSSSGGFTGQQGTRLSWRLNAFDRAQPTRRLAIFTRGLPSTATTEPDFTQKITNEIRISYTPPQAESGVVEVFIRDYDRCLVTETEKPVCLSSIFNPAYDRQQPNIQYQFQGTSVKKCPTPGLFSSPPPGC